MRKQLASAQFGAAAPRKGALALCLALCTLGLGVSTNAQEKKAEFFTFDAPGAGIGAFQGTLGLTINPKGEIVGYYLDSGNVAHAFVRSRNGTITSFDAPGAGTGAFQGTIAYGINPPGAVVGPYFDSNYVFHSFLRQPHGTITTFDAPGAGT